ncbi:hypothetical protein K1T71_002141 [Dendrolimus kikuchii]|uniref:Uncharacterized protein n=1 Tax=Dendrolimus kikuchii TaxID=765133 RepID=A0ACC1DGN6_9NEOP|nr:hypothetical protein K1T71_002141 [Dendrolimus kikuchii]
MLFPHIFYSIGLALMPPVDLNRESRSLYKRKLCRKYGICEGQGYGGHGGYQNSGYGGYGSHSGYGGYPINIAISQSQSAANAAGGGYSYGSYPNNYQYNGYNGHKHGYNQGVLGYDGNGYGLKPGFNNGPSSYNSQFNGNYNRGGYGSNSGYYEENEGYDYSDYDFGRSAGGKSSAVAEADSKND